LHILDSVCYKTFTVLHPDMVMNNPLCIPPSFQCRNKDPILSSLSSRIHNLLLMELPMKLNLWPVKGINVYDLPPTLRAMFPYYSANEEDCVPQHEQARPDSHRELKADETDENTTFVPVSDYTTTSKVLDFPNR